MQLARRAHQSGLWQVFVGTATRKNCLFTHIWSVKSSPLKYLLQASGSISVQPLQPLHRGYQFNSLSFRPLGVCVECSTLTPLPCACLIKYFHLTQHRSVEQGSCDCARVWSRRTALICLRSVSSNRPPVIIFNRNLFRERVHSNKW